MPGDLVRWGHGGCFDRIHGRVALRNTLEEENNKEKYGRLFSMKILTIDVGTGTQDIFLYDLHLDLENGFKLIVPSPTMIVTAN